MIEKQFGAEYGPALQRGDKTACIVSLQAEIDRLGAVPYGWMRIYEVLLFGFYNPRNHARIVFNELANGFAAQTPHSGEVADPIVFFEGGVLNQHGSTFRRSSFSRAAANRGDFGPAGNWSLRLWNPRPHVHGTADHHGRGSRQPAGPRRVTCAAASEPIAIYDCSSDEFRFAADSVCLRFEVRQETTLNSSVGQSRSAGDRASVSLVAALFNQHRAADACRLRTNRSHDWNPRGVLVVGTAIIWVHTSLFFPGVQLRAVLVESGIPAVEERRS